MASFERTNAKSLDLPNRVTLLGKTTEHADFDPVKFARSIVRSRKPKMTLQERQAKQRAMEEKIARY